MLATHPVSISNLYSQTFSLWPSFFKKILVLAFICTILPISITQYAWDFWRVNHISTEKLEIILLIILINIIISMGSYTALLLKTNSLLLNQPLATSILLKTIFIKIPALIIAFCISIVAVFLGSAVFIIPGFYILGMIFIFYPVVILYSNNPFKDFITSYHLIHHHWWRTFFVIIFPLIMISLFSSFIAYLLAQATSSITNVPFQFALCLLGQSLIMSPFSVWISTQMLLLINDLKLRNVDAIQ